MSKRALLILVAVLVAALAVFAILLSRQRLRRHRVVQASRPPATEAVRKGIPPAAEWTATFSALEARGQWDELAELLDGIAKQQPAEYARFSLQYLHARALLENNDNSAAVQKLAPYLQPGNPFRDLALYHQSEIDDERNDGAAASRSRQALIFEYPGSIYRDQAIDDEIDHLASGSAQALVAFASRVNPSAPTARRRDIEARIIEALQRSGDSANALARGLALLAAGTADDPSDRVARVLDRPELIARMTPQQTATLGESMQSHRRFDRAVALLSLALTPLPAKRDDLLFAIGRSWFGDEKYAEAQQTYLRGAASTKDPKQKSTFLLHASRAAQLRGDDRAAEQLMTAAIAVPGTHPGTTAALTQRIRTRLKQRRVAEASADLQQLRKIAPKDPAIVDGSLAFAVAMVASGNPTAALNTLSAIPPALLNKFDRPEVAYWRARALETRDPHAAFVSYLSVLRAPVPTHFAYFARERLASPALAGRLRAELATRDAEVDRLIAARNFVVAKQVATDAILLTPSGDREGQPPPGAQAGKPAPHGALARRRQKLAAIYREIPQYRAVLELQPEPFPSLPSAGNDRLSRLLSLGLFDEAIDEIPKKWPLKPVRSGLTQSLALNRGAASKPSIYAIEVLMNSVPSDYIPDLLPLVVRQLLYPRYFEQYILEDSQKFGADPTLVLSIMREESRFNPRAKSQAAARGLLQFIIVTARDIGREIGLVDVSPEDLYDPRVIIRLGAKYVATLTKQFGGDRYAAAAAYNAGPKQVALWARLAPAPGDDYFLSSINFDETKDYVRKVLNSYKRYGEIYGNTGPVGGLRAEP